MNVGTSQRSRLRCFSGHLLSQVFGELMLYGENPLVVSTLAT